MVWLLAVLFGVLVLWRGAVGVRAVRLVQDTLGVQLPARWVAGTAAAAAVASLVPLGLFVWLGARYLSVRRVQEWRNLANASAYELLLEVFEVEPVERPTLVPTAG